MNPTRCTRQVHASPVMRSKLFVPGSRPELFDKAMGSQADAISIDLEDAVVEERKAQARDTVGRWLRERKRPTQDKCIIVRVNGMDTPHFALDVAAVVQPGLDVLNLPKPDSVAAVREAVQAIAAAEQANGVTQPVRLLLNIETPKALREAAALGQAHPRVMGLQVGLGDLFEPLGIDRREVTAVQQVMFAVRMAAGEAGIDAFDGAFANVADTDAYLAEAQLAHRMGLSGKTCIHPSQIALANQVFRPSEAQIRHAMKVVEAARHYDAAGQGAFVVDGHMIDGPFLRRAQNLLAQARRLGIDVPA
jgi:citrate lyase beta subunit